MATNITTDAIIKVLERLSKNNVPKYVCHLFIQECTKRYGKAKLVLKHNNFFVESEHPSVLRELLRDLLISQARIADDLATGIEKDSDYFFIQTKALKMTENLQMLKDEDDSKDEDTYITV